MANPDEGVIECPACHNEAPVRKNVRGKLYIMCPHCGQMPMNLPGGQDFILSNARFYGPDGELPDRNVNVTEPEPVTGDDSVMVIEAGDDEPEPVTKPEPEQAPPKKPAFFDLDW